MVGAENNAGVGYPESKVFAEKKAWHNIKNEKPLRKPQSTQMTRSSFRLSSATAASILR